MVSIFSSPTLRPASENRTKLQSAGVVSYISGCKTNGYEILVAQGLEAKAKKILEVN